MTHSFPTRRLPDLSDRGPQRRFGSENEQSVRAVARGERQLLQEDSRLREVGDMKGHAEDAIAEPAELGRIARHELDDRVVTDLKGAAPVAPGGRNLDAAHEALIEIGRAHV